jgi:hypothetical protein
LKEATDYAVIVRHVCHYQPSVSGKNVGGFPVNAQGLRDSPNGAISGVAFFWIRLIISPNVHGNRLLS